MFKMASMPSARLAALVSIAHDAGRVIMRHYRAGVEARKKSDQSPVTDADEEAERLILARLKDLAPDIPVVAEEEMAAGRLPKIGNHFFLVDPLDGTKEFIDRNGEFTVNIALVEHGLPVLGVVLVPTTGISYTALGAGTARRGRGTTAAEPIGARPVPPEGLTVVHSRSHESSAA